MMELALYHMSYLAKFQWIVFHTGARQFQQVSTDASANYKVEKQLD